MKPGDFVVSDLYHRIKRMSDFYHGIKANQDKERYSDVVDFFKGIKEKGKNTNLHIEVVGLIFPSNLAWMLLLE